MENNKPTIHDILDEAKDVIQFHVDSTYSDTDEVEVNLIKKIDIYNNSIAIANTPKLYTENDMKNFGLYLGSRLITLKRKSIDDIFENYIK
jgi:hypothetical protein